MSTLRNLVRLCLLAALLLTLPALSRAQFICATNNGTITIAGYTGSGGAVAIPSAINGLPVTSIGNRAFNAAKIVSVLIPDSVIIIGQRAFMNCTNLTNVTVGSRVVSLGGWAFASCPRLKSIDCRGNAPGLGGPNVFKSDSATIYYLSGTSGWGNTLGGRPTVLWNPPVPFAYTTNSDAIAITGYAGPGGAVTIPGSINFLPVTSIGDFAFNLNSGLTSVIIPDGVTSIGYTAFSSCGSLTNVTIPGSVTNIASWAFSYCGSLASIKIPDNVTTIEYGVFYGCSSLTSVTIGNSVTSILQEAFWNTGLKSVNIPNSVKSIDASVFASDNLTNVTIGNGLTNDGDGFYTCPFYACPDLMAITVDASNPAYYSEDGILFDKNRDILIEYPRGLSGSYEVPESVTSIGNYAFFYCTYLPEIFFSGNAPGLDSFVFSGDSALTVYYLYGTTGWGPTFGGAPTALWNPQMQAIAPGFGGENNPFGFNISGNTNLVIVVEASTNLTDWQPVQTNTLTGGSVYFSDPQWTNYPSRYYRLRSP